MMGWIFVFLCSAPTKWLHRQRGLRAHSNQQQGVRRGDLPLSLKISTPAHAAKFAWEALMAAAETALQDPLLALTMSAELKPRHAGLLGFWP